MNKRRNLVSLLERLDEKSRAMVWYLWWRRHAQVHELCRLINGENDYEVLYRLKDIINRQAKILLGKPLVAFRPARIDPATGDKVLFSWWFDAEADDADDMEATRPVADVFADEDSASIVARVPTWVDITRQETRLNNGILQVRLPRKTMRE